MKGPTPAFRVLALLAALLSGVLGGCLGKTGPAEEYLRVLGRSPNCDAAVTGAPAQVGRQGRITVALKTLKVSDSLGRQAVMLANGRVLTASQSWYWEAAPGMLVTQAVLRDINCSGRMAAVWPVRFSTKAAMVLAGQVTAFEVQTRDMHVRAGVHCQLWDGEESRSLGTRYFEATAPLAGLSAQAIADAGASVLERLSADVRTWVEDAAPAVSKPAQGE